MLPVECAGLESPRLRLKKYRSRHFPSVSPINAGGEDPCGERRMVMTWFTLVLAGLLEVGWAIGLKYSAGFTRPVPSTLTVIAMVGSVVLLGLALRDLPLGTAYAVWTGIGTVGTVIFGIVVFGEPASAARLFCIALITAGILGLKLVSAPPG
jgi:quaternary ammonium compound-resistance protein SugE